MGGEEGRNILAIFVGLATPSAKAIALTLTLFPQHVSRTTKAFLPKNLLGTVVVDPPVAVQDDLGRARAKQRRRRILAPQAGKRGRDGTADSGQSARGSAEQQQSVSQGGLVSSLRCQPLPAAKDCCDTISISDPLTSSKPSARSHLPAFPHTVMAALYAARLPSAIATRPTVPPALLHLPSPPAGDVVVVAVAGLPPPPPPPPFHADGTPPVAAAPDRSLPLFPTSPWRLPFPHQSGKLLLLMSSPSSSTLLLSLPPLLLPVASPTAEPPRSASAPRANAAAAAAAVVAWLTARGRDGNAVLISTSNSRARFQSPVRPHAVIAVVYVVGLGCIPSFRIVFFFFSGRVARDREREGESVVPPPGRGARVAVHDIRIAGKRVRGNNFALRVNGMWMVTNGMCSGDLYAKIRKEITPAIVVAPVVTKRHPSGGLGAETTNRPRTRNDQERTYLEQGQRLSRLSTGGARFDDDVVQDLSDLQAQPPDLVKDLERCRTALRTTRRCQGQKKKKR